MLDALKARLIDDVTGQDRAQTRMDLPGVMILLVIAAVVGFVGLNVISTVIDTTSLQGDNASKAGWQGDPLFNASESLQTAVNDAWGLVGVAFIVVILAVIIVYLYGLRGGRGR